MKLVESHQLIQDHHATPATIACKFHLPLCLLGSAPCTPGLRLCPRPPPPPSSCCWWIWVGQSDRWGRSPPWWYRQIYGCCLHRKERHLRVSVGTFEFENRLKKNRSPCIQQVKEHRNFGGNLHVADLCKMFCGKTCILPDTQSYFASDRRRMHSKVIYEDKANQNCRLFQLGLFPSKVILV